MTSAFAESQIEGLLIRPSRNQGAHPPWGLGSYSAFEPERHVSMLEIALDEGRITESLGAEIAAELGIPTRHVQESDGFYDHSDNTLSAYEDSADSMVDGLPDALTRPGVDSAPPLQDISDPDETGPVSIPPMARVFAEPSLLPPPAQSDDDLDEMTEPRLKRSPAPVGSIETVDVSLTDSVYGGWETAQPAIVDRLTESRPVDALRQRALRHADAFLALVRSKAQPDHVRCSALILALAWDKPRAPLDLYWHPGKQRPPTGQFLNRS